MSSVLGVVLVVAGDSAFITLFVVILFHQVFEGIALGTRVAIMPSGLMRKIVLGLAFAITTPIGMAIGIGILTEFNGNNPSTIIAIGTLNAFSAGILLWIGITEMWFKEWWYGPLAHAGIAKTLVGFFGLVLGLVLMSLLGNWA
jgi:solute carrier family 39 (zinc transporter), member 1/2/3